MRLTLNMPFDHELHADVHSVDEALQILKTITQWTSFTLIATRTQYYRSTLQDPSQPKS
jgi:hypothetical protein